MSEYNNALDVTLAKVDNGDGLEIRLMSYAGSAPKIAFSKYREDKEGNRMWLKSGRLAVGEAEWFAKTGLSLLLKKGAKHLKAAVKK